MSLLNFELVEQGPTQVLFRLAKQCICGILGCVKVRKQDSIWELAEGCTQLSTAPYQQLTRTCGVADAANQFSLRSSWVLLQTLHDLHVFF